MKISSDFLGKAIWSDLIVPERGGTQARARAWDTFTVKHCGCRLGRGIPG